MRQVFVIAILLAFMSSTYAEAAKRHYGSTYVTHHHKRKHQ